MIFLSEQRMRIGGVDGSWHLLFGDWADLGEGVVEMEFSACRQCRRVEMRIPGGVRPEESQLFTDRASDLEPPVESDAKAWNPLLGPPPAGER
jgi:hypothetical protein